MENITIMEHDGEIQLREPQQTIITTRVYE